MQIRATKAEAETQAFALVFENNHGFNQWQTGLTFMGIFCGMVIGVNCDPLWQKNCEVPGFSLILRKTKTNRPTDTRLVNNNGGVSEPEFRLPPTILYVLHLFGPIDE